MVTLTQSQTTHPRSTQGRHCPSCPKYGHCSLEEAHDNNTTRISG